MEQGRYVPVIIGGMARSGTTLLSALVSTSKAFNPFAPELHTLGYLAQAISSLTLPDQAFFYRDKEERLRQHFLLFRNVLDEAWAALGRPKQLVVKQCALTTVCGLIGRYLPQARFLSIMRDPLDIFESMWRAKFKYQGVDRLGSLTEHWILRFNQTYGTVIKAAMGELKGRHLAVSYKSLCEGNLAPLSAFLRVSDIEPPLLWARAAFDIRTYKKDPLFSDGWGKPMYLSSLRSHRSELDASVSEKIQRDTEVVRKAFLELALHADSRNERKELA